MKKGSDVIAFAKKFNGRGYDFGAMVPKDLANYKGKFDCAEFVAYCNFQVFGILYGCNTDKVKNASIADAYTGYFKKDALALGEIIPVQSAIRIPGAMLLRYPAPGAIGHIVFSQGNGETVEAHSTKEGCGEFGTDHRRFDVGLLLPGVLYDKANLSTVSQAPTIVYRLKQPVMEAEFIGDLQKALGFKGKDVDNKFGAKTNQAVIAYQKEHGLVVDGEVAPGGETASLLKI